MATRVCSKLVSISLGNQFSVATRKGSSYADCLVLSAKCTMETKLCFKLYPVLQRTTKPQGNDSTAKMGGTLETNGDQELGLDIKTIDPDQISSVSTSLINVPFAQKMIAEVLGTFFLVLAGCGAIMVNADKEQVITFPGIAVVCGLAVMTMVYSVGHISGCHINPAVTIAFAASGRFPWKQVLPYVTSQITGAVLANGSLRLIFSGTEDHFAGSSPAGSDLQAVVLEFLITFYLMFVVSGVATDNRAIGELAGLAIGATIVVNIMFAGPISSASMNPARSLGSAVVWNRYKGVWIYVVGPISGAVCGAWVYNLIRFTDKPLREIAKSRSFLKGSSRGSSNGSV